MKEIFTGLVRIKGNSKYKVVSVKSSKEVDIKMFIEFSKVLGRIYVSLPINVGDVICSNILNTGIDIVSTKKIIKNS
ncbi:MAG: DUF1667 domain-containing protein [Clostridiales bacterium]|nr:DUF1667 domain-containing protein [Clostridiales bacterium]